MVTSRFNGKYYETVMNYKTLDNNTIYISNYQDTPLVFNFELYTLEIKDIIGMSKVKLVLSFKHLIDLIVCALDCIDYAEPTIINIPSTNVFESYSIVFDYIDDINIKLLIYLRNPYTSIALVDIPFDFDHVVGLTNTILDDFLEKNHRIQAIKQLHDSGIIMY